jgi:maltose alpha-D-glucosyltransferase/alpha-amylase
LILGQSSVLKLVRRLTPGIHPEAEMTRYLSRAGYGNTAGLQGEVVRVDQNGVAFTLMILQRFIANQGDAWSWTLDFLRRTVDDAVLSDADTGGFDQDLLGYVPLAQAMGLRLGQLHATLAAPTSDQAFAPVVAGPSDVAALAEQVKAAFAKALPVISSQKSFATERETKAAALVLQYAAQIDATIDQLAGFLQGTLLTRIHGDLHLGQILVAQSDAYLIDFEGEPARSLEERRAKSSPLRDVSGVLRSFDYAAATLRRASREVTPETDTIAVKREILLQRFLERAQTAFLEGYRQVARSTEHPWASAQAETALIDLFLLGKASYEVAYEAANRPEWVGLPVAGLAHLIGRLMQLDDDAAPPLHSKDGTPDVL